MFLHKKLTHAPSKRLIADIKFDFDFNSDDIFSCINVERKGKSIESLFQHYNYNLKGAAMQALAGNGIYFYFMTEAGLYLSYNATYYALIHKKSAQNLGSCTYRNGVIVSGKDYGTYYVVNEEVTQLLDHGFSSVTCCRDRLFGLNGNEVSYTEAGTSNGWANGETITLETDCEALVTVGDKVYALGNVCYAISPDAEDKEFQVTRCAINIGVISKASVVNYNGTAVFASSSGLFQITSNKITPICKQLNDYFDMGISCATLFDGRYYISCKRRNTFGQNTITFSIDVDEEEVCGIFYSGLDSIGSASKFIYGIRNGGCSWFNKNSASGTYFKSNIDFGCRSKKFLDSLTVITRSNMTLTLRSDNETRLFTFQGKKTEQKIKLRGMGSQFSIEMTAKLGLDVDKLQLEAHVCEEV